MPAHTSCRQPASIATSLCEQQLASSLCEQQLARAGDGTVHPAMQVGAGDGTCLPAAAATEARPTPFPQQLHIPTAICRALVPP